MMAVCNNLVSGKIRAAHFFVQLFAPIADDDVSRCRTLFYLFSRFSSHVIFQGGATCSAAVRPSSVKCIEHYPSFFGDDDQVDCKFAQLKKSVLVKIRIHCSNVNVFFVTQLPQCVVHTQKLKTVETGLLVAPRQKIFAFHVGVAGAEAHRAAHVAGRVTVAAVQIIFSNGLGEKRGPVFVLFGGWLTQITVCFVETLSTVDSVSTRVSETSGAKFSEDVFLEHLCFFKAVMKYSSLTGVLVPNGFKSKRRQRTIGQRKNVIFKIIDKVFSSIDVSF
jgi:hypothetical protein